MKRGEIMPTVKINNICTDLKTCSVCILYYEMNITHFKGHNAQQCCRRGPKPQGQVQAMKNKGLMNCPSHLQVDWNE